MASGSKTVTVSNGGVSRPYTLSASTSGSTLSWTCSNTNISGDQPWTWLEVWIGGSCKWSYHGGGQDGNYTSFPMGRGTSTSGTVDVSGMSSVYCEIKYNQNSNSCNCADGFTLALFAMPGQTFVTRSTNNSSGNKVDSGDQAIDTDWRYIRPASESKSWAGDSFTFWVDKNHPESLGSNSYPWSWAQVQVGGPLGTSVHEGWASHGDGNDRSNSWDVDIKPEWAGQNVAAVIGREYHNSSNVVESHFQWAGHYIQPIPTVSSNTELRSKRFYTGTPSCMVWRLLKWDVTTNGYGKRASTAAGLTWSNATTRDVVNLSLGSYNGMSGNFQYGDSTFDGNYSLPATPLEFHSASKITPSSSPVATKATFAYTNYFNPRRGQDRLGYIKGVDQYVDVVSGSINLPVIDKISASSGNGTTAIVESTKHIWTNQSNVLITWRIDHSGNANGFAYDIRFSDITINSSSPKAPTKVGGTAVVPSTNLDVWSPPYGNLNVTAATTKIQHDSITETGVSKRVTVIPSITDSAGYRIFGEKTRAYVESPTYTIYKIKIPNTPTLNKWSNTLPAIDGIKDEIKWEATSPSSWGNVTDFAHGYKLRYKIGNDTAKADGWQWKYINTPTTTNTKFSGSIKEKYNRASYTSCVGSLCATSYYSTTWNGYLDFQSAYVSKSFTVSAKDPYKATTGTITTPEATTLKTEVPYTFKCPQETINGNALIQTTKISIDGGTATTITSPTYTTSTPNSLTGALTLKFNDLKLNTKALARGAHTIVITNEVATYFDSTTPVTNHVYFGTTTVTSNTLKVEVAELPKKPNLKTPNPQFYKAGGYRKFKFEWTAGDWGCLDTTYNDRHYDYEWIDPSGNVIASNIFAKTTTSVNNWNVLMVSPTHEGTYTFKLRQTTVVGSSAWATTTIEIQKAEEPGKSEIKATDILALPNWQWNLKINPGSNGSYNKLPSTMPATSYWFQTKKYSPGGTTAANFERSLRVDLTLASQNLTNKTSTINYSISTRDGTNANSYTSGTRSAKVNIANTKVNLNGSNIYTQSGTASSYNGYVLKSGSITINHNKNTNFGKTSYYNAMFVGNSSTTIGGKNLTGTLKGMALPAVPDSRVEARYKADVVLPSYIDTLLGTETYTVSAGHYKVNISDFANSSYIGKDVWYNYGDGSALTKEQTHEYDVVNSAGAHSIKIYKRNINGYTSVKNIIGWTTINNNVKLDKDYTSNLNGYENGLYKVLVQYERNYTVKTVRDMEFFDIIPPEVKIYDSSHIISCSESSNTIVYQLTTDVYAGTDVHTVEYSMDYGKSWISLNVTRTDGAHQYFEKQLNLTWLDEIWIRARGKNPVSEKTRIFYHEMPSDYKVWLSWCDKNEHKINEEFFTVYEYNYDELEDIFTVGALKLTIDNSMKITTPYIYAGFADAKTGEWVNMNGVNYNNIGKPEILANDGIHNSSINITKALLDRRDVVFRIGFKGEKGKVINDNITFIPRLIQGSKNNLLDINRIFADYQDRTLKYHYTNGKIAVTRGNCTITNNRDNSFTISRETKPNSNFIRRLSMSYKGATPKKVRRIKKI